MAMKPTVGGYNGNPHLPKKDSSYAYTQEQASEIAKCMADPVYFAETYFKIISVDDGLIPFKLYDFQKEAARSYLTERKMILATSRQIGKTSIATVIVLHYALFNAHKRVFILANKADTALEILSRIQLAYEHLPNWLKAGVIEWNKSSVEFDNGSRIKAAATSSDNIRGQSANFIYIDEAAFVQGWTDFSASVLPTISSGKKTKLVFTSTPNGLNHFYDYYNGAKKGTNGFKLIEVKWFDVPGRDEAWRQETLATINHDEMRFAQEYEVEFLGSSGTLISGAKLKQLFADIQPPIEYNAGYGYKIWGMPRKARIYAMIVDTSRGKGMDYSAFQVIDITETPYKQVATFRNNMITPPDYTSFIYQTAKAYNQAYCLVEINDIGGQVADILTLDYGYENVIHTENAGAKGRRVSSGFGGSTIDRGIRTTKTVKSLGCSMLKLLIEQDTIVIRDADTINELAVFSRNGDSYEAEPGFHDDLVMCLVLLSWLTTDTYFKHLNDSDIMHSLRDLTEEQIYETLSPFGIVSGGWDNRGNEPVVERIGGEDWTVTSIGSLGTGWD